MTVPASRSRLIAAFAAVYLIWGSTYLAIRFGVATIPPFIMAGIRFTIAGALLYAWLRFRGAPKPTRAHWRSAAIIGFLLLVAGNGVVAWAEQVVPSGLTALVIAAVPMWMVLMDWMFNKVRPNKTVVIGLLMGFAGIAFLVDPGELSGNAMTDVAGFAALMIATISWAGGSLYSRSAHLPDSPFLSTAMEMLVAGVMLFVVGFWLGEGSAFDMSRITLQSAGAVGYLIVAGSLLGLTSYIWLLRATTTARASTYAYVNPVVAVFLGWLIADEQLTGRMMIAAVIIVAAVILIITYRGRAPQPKADTVIGTKPEVALESHS